MNIIATQYSIETKSLDIYLAGCLGPHCTNCHNPESWDFNQGTDWREWIPKINAKLSEFETLIENVMVIGGEPLDQELNSLRDFCLELNYMVWDDLWFFTGYDAIRVPDFVKKHFNYIKCGRYIEELKTEDNTQYGIKLASSNQIIYKKGRDY